MELLISELKNDLKRHCIRGNSDWMKELLEKDGVTDGYEFGKVYKTFENFKERYCQAYIWCVA